jgi:hypothetical protein
MLDNGVPFLSREYGFNGMLILDKSFAGPYNFVQFIILPDGEIVPNYSGIGLEVIANAREL